MPHSATPLRRHAGATGPLAAPAGNRTRYPRIALLALVAATLSGCAALLHGGAGGAVFLAPAAGHLHLPSTADSATVAIAYRNPSDYEEYRSVIGDARTEAVLSVASGPQTALAFPGYRLEALTAGWRFNGDDRLRDWHGPRTLRSGDRAFDVADYTHAAGGHSRDCFAFQRHWATVAEDPRQRPGLALFGYHCAAPGQALTAADVAHFLAGLRVDDRAPRSVHFGDHVADDAAARQRARGRAGALQGNPDFPFRFARYYTIGGDDESLH